MKNVTLAIAAASVSMALSSAAKAEETKTTFYLDHDVLSLHNTSTKPETGDTVKSSDLQSTPTDITIAAFWDTYGLYVTPGKAGGTFGLSYLPKPEIEFGVLLGLNNNKVEKNAAAPFDPENKYQAVTLFTTYYLTINDKSSAEFGLNLTSSTWESKDKATAAGESVTSLDDKAMTVGLLAQYVFQIAPHVNLVPGIALSQTTTKHEAGLVSSEDKSMFFQLNILHFRYIF